MRVLLLSSLLLAPIVASTNPAFAAVLASPASDSDLLSETFSVDGSTAVPGTVLKSGSYVIRVVDHMSDRSILRVEKDGKTLTTFLAVPNRRLAGEGGKGPLAWTGGGSHDKALRGFNFPGSYSVEFVYPKAEAVKIAVAHDASVEAIDPASDNLPSKQKNLSSEDMRIVTLWTLSPTRVSGSTAIAAEKYKPAEPVPAPAPVIARNEPPPAALPAPRAARTVPPAPVAAAPVAAPRPAVRRPLAAALPHTASNLPAVLLVGFLSLCGLATLRTARLLRRG